MNSSSDSHHERDNASGSGSWWTGGLVVLALVALGLFLVLRSLDQPPPTPPPDPKPPLPEAVRLSAEDCLDLQRLKTQGIALLENGKELDAEKSWDAISKKLPAEPLVARNRALGRLLVLAKDRSDKAFASAATSIADLQTVDGKSWVSAWIEGRLQLLEKDRQDALEKHDARLAAAVRAFARAGELGPDRAIPRYELYQAAKLAHDKAIVAQGRAALREAYRLDPANIFIALDWLEVAAETQDPTFPDAVAEFLKTIRPLLAGLKRRTRIDVEAFIGQAVDQASKGQWSQATGVIRRLGFVRSEDVAQSDYRRILPNPLELLLHDFQRATCEPAVAPALPSSDVQFVPRHDDGLKLEGGDLRDMRVLDFDLDGSLDVVVLQATRLIVFARDALPAEVSSKDPSPPVAAASWKLLLSHEVGDGFTHFLAADFDRDDKGGGQIDASFYQADADFVLYGPTGVLVLRNQLDEPSGVRRLEAVAQEGGLERLAEVLTATLADFDHDGDLDVALAAESGIGLWINRGNLTFDDVTSSSSMPPVEVKPTSLVAVDWDRDIDADLLVADASGRSVGYLENLRHIEFRWRPLGKEFDALRSASSLAIVESDGNVSWDVLAAGDQGLKLLLTTTPVPGSIQPLKSLDVSPESVRGATSWDYDNDGDPDAIAWGDRLRVFRGGPDGTLTPVAPLFAEAPLQVKTCEPADLDGDGDLDLVVATATDVSIWRNEGGNRNPWLDVLVRGLDESISGRVNHFAIGSWVEIKAGPHYQAQLVTRPYTHFGLGASRENVDIVRVLFTNGVPQSVIAPAANQVVREAQALKGSCPYLYVWNGERFEFFTDLLWAAPLGLQIADGVILRDRPWEYLKVDGDKLRARDGAYRLQITEELWEAGYFDQVELIAVDHPADVEVFSNEKVGPAEVSARRIHAVQRRRSPVAARDARGRNLLPLVERRDGQFAQCYERTFRQGLAEEHFLELDLGKLADPKRVTLFLTGWIYPTDTSLNVGLSQNPDLDGPRPPFIRVPDDKGGWREAMAYMGFPGGKTKTVAIDVSDIFPPGDYRLRIVTTAEIRWDEAFFTVDEPAVEVRETTLTLRSADLHYRGCSLPLPRAARTEPERYDYERVEAAPRWPPMRGRFTRYGDVRELLTEWDDRMVVFGAGDEMTVDFDVGPPLPPGWKRDFLLHNVGWDKDADIHTVYGQTVEPMPFRAMPSYPYAAESYPTDPRIAEYLRVYQTREQSPAEFWRLLKNR